MLAAFRRVENGVRYDYVLTSTNEANGRLDGTRSETTLSTGVTVDKGAWAYVLLSCVPACVAGTTGFHRGVVAGEKVNPFNTCYENCLTLAVPRLDLGVSVTTGNPVQTYATWELVRKAEACDSATSTLPSLPSSGTTPTPPTPEPECPAGQRRVYFASGVPSCAPIPEDRFCPVGYTYGTINGKDTCISQSNGPPTSTSPTTTDKTPTTESKESSTTVTNPDGSTTTTTTKSDGRGGGSVTTTTKSSDGKTVESVTKKMGDDPDGKCEPGTLGCMKPGTPTGNGPSKTDRTATLGGAGLTGFTSECPADRNVDTHLGTIHLSFSSMCTLGPNLKPLILLAAALIAMAIVISSLRS
jgi:hypothetical protein